MHKHKDKKDRFKKLAESRTNEVLHKLKVLGNCSNRSAYFYEEEEIIKIFTEIDKQLKEVKSKFHFTSKRRFKL